MDLLRYGRAKKKLDKSGFLLGTKQMSQFLPYLTLPMDNLAHQDMVYSFIIYLLMTFGGYKIESYFP